MGFGGGSPQITTINPNTPAAQGTQNAAGDFFSQLFKGGVGGNPFGGLGGQGLSGQAGNAMSSFLGQQNPQLQTFNQGIMNFAQGGSPGGIGVGAGALGLPGNVNVFGNAMDAGQQQIAALAPLRQMQQQSALGQLSNAAGNRFSTAFNQQGIDLMSQFGAQNAAQDAGILNAGQGMNLQQAQGNQANQLGAAGLLNNFFQGNAGLQMQQRQNQFGNMLGASQNMFNQNQGQFQNMFNAGNFGLQQNMAGIAPFLQMLGMGAQWSQPAPMETLVQQQQGGGLGGFLGTLAGGALGSFLGPMGGAAGANIGNRLFGGGGGGTNYGG